MARQVMSKRRTETISKELGFPIEKIMVRGNTGHRKDLCLPDGHILHYWPDGVITHSTDWPQLWFTHFSGEKHA